MTSVVNYVFSKVYKAVVKYYKFFKGFLFFFQRVRTISYRCFYMLIVVWITEFLLTKRKF